MRDSVQRQWDSIKLHPQVAFDLLERAHSIARGAEVAIRVARICSVQRESGGAAVIDNADSDDLLALAGAASAFLADKLESLSERKSSDEYWRISDDEQSLRGIV
ncbi:hypothetical protein V4C53_17955 [Paraburkholderia azotifigens]|uniref:hypothetical protein n=1 Tax=Paraburkholderia azotifigens TaxID=2057004 RepID=UPI003177EFBB